MNSRTVLQSAFAVLCGCLLSIPAIAQPLLPQQDPDDDRKLGLWIDQAISIGLSENRSLEFAFHQRFDEGGTNLSVYSFTKGMEFRARPWLAFLPAYRYLRYPGDATTSYENRLMLTVTMTAKRGRWRPILRTLIEGRIPKIALPRHASDCAPASNITCRFAWHARRWWS